MLKHLPNALTTSRLVLAPVIAFAVWQAYAVRESQLWALAAAGMFVFAALTDLVDGLAARLLKADSKLGRMLDPIADKALVGLPLIAISIVAWQIGQPLWWLVAIPTAVIVLRDLLITAFRLMASDAEGVRVSQLAKWKTAVELVAVGLPILAVAAPSFVRTSGLGEGASGGPVVMFLWLALLVVAAALSAVTAVQYVIRARPMPLVQPAADRSVEDAAPIAALESSLAQEAGEPDAAPAGQAAAAAAPVGEPGSHVDEGLKPGRFVSE